MKTAKILLINTARKYAFPKKATPPLGLMYLASVLRQKNSHQVKILDMKLGYLEPTGVLSEFSGFKPDIVGISSMTNEANALHQLAKEIKKVSSCEIIAGGPHVTTCPENGLNDPNIDYIVLGEGEYTLLELVETILRGGDASQVKGIAFRSNGSFVKTSPREYIQNLDELPHPAWDLIKLKEYGRYWGHDILQPPRTYMSIITSRGCPYHCIYCHNIMGRRFRARSVENVFSEIETLYCSYNIRNFTIEDDIFNFDRERVFKICDLIIKSGLKVNLSFPNGLRGDLMDEEQLLKLRQAGTYSISYGVEVGSSRIQKLIRKNMNLARIEEIISKTSELGILTNGYFMLGFPTETRKDLDETAKFALRSKLDLASFFIANPFPNTELSQMVKGKDKDVNNDFESFSYLYTKTNLSEVEDKELFAIQKKIYRYFYLNPKRIFRLLLKVPNKKGLLCYFIFFLVRVLFSRSKKINSLLCRLRPF